MRVWSGLCDCCILHWIVYYEAPPCGASYNFSFSLRVADFAAFKVLIE